MEQVSICGKQEDLFHPESGLPRPNLQSPDRLPRKRPLEAPSPPPSPIPLEKSPYGGQIYKTFQGRRYGSTEYFNGSRGSRTLRGSVKRLRLDEPHLAGAQNSSNTHERQELLPDDYEPPNPGSGADAPDTQPEEHARVQDAHNRFALVPNSVPDQKCLTTTSSPPNSADPPPAEGPPLISVTPATPLEEDLLNSPPSPANLTPCSSPTRPLNSTTPHTVYVQLILLFFCPTPNSFLALFCQQQRNPFSPLFGRNSPPFNSSQAITPQSSSPPSSPPIRPGSHCSLLSSININSIFFLVRYRSVSQTEPLR